MGILTLVYIHRLALKKDERIERAERADSRGQSERKKKTYKYGNGIGEGRRHGKQNTLTRLVGWINHSPTAERARNPEMERKVERGRRCDAYA
jgi:hypothetical protein